MKPRTGKVVDENRESNTQVRPFGYPSNNKGWVKCFSSSIPGRPYYFNIKTGSSTWILPVPKNVHLPTFEGARIAKQKSEPDKTMDALTVSDFEEEKDENSTLIPTFNHDTGSETESDKKRAEVAWKLFRTSSAESPSHFLQGNVYQIGYSDEIETQLSDEIDDEDDNLGNSQVINDHLEVNYSTASEVSDPQESASSPSEQDGFDEVSNRCWEEFCKLKELKSISHEDFKKMGNKPTSVSLDDSLKENAIMERIRNSRKKLRFHDDCTQPREEKSGAGKRLREIDAPENNVFENGMSEGNKSPETIENTSKKMKLGDTANSDSSSSSTSSTNDEETDSETSEEEMEDHENGVSGDISSGGNNFSEIIENTVKESELDSMDFSDSLNKSTDDEKNIAEKQSEQTDDNEDGDDVAEKRLERIDDDDNQENIITQEKTVSSLMDHPYALQSSSDNYSPNNSNDSNVSSLHPPTPVPYENISTPLRKIKELFAKKDKSSFNENNNNKSIEIPVQNDAKVIEKPNEGENDSNSARESKECGEVNQKEKNPTE